METRSSWVADCSTSFRPTGVDPVKVSLRVRASRTSGSTTCAVRVVVMTLSTPAGSPTSSSRAARASIDSGVCVAGLTTMVQPAAMAGPILRVPIASGKFHGVIIRVGPTGFFMVSSRVAPLGAVIHRPEMRTASSENHRKNSAP